MNSQWWALARHHLLQHYPNLCYFFHRLSGIISLRGLTKFLFEAGKCASSHHPEAPTPKIRMKNLAESIEVTEFGCQPLTFVMSWTAAFLLSLAGPEPGGNPARKGTPKNYGQSHFLIPFLHFSHRYSWMNSCNEMSDWSVRLGNLVLADASSFEVRRMRFFREWRLREGESRWDIVAYWKNHLKFPTHTSLRIQRQNGNIGCDCGLSWLFSSWWSN